MTDFKPYPETRVTFPETAKIQGEVRVHFTGNGRMGIMTEHSRLTFRGDDSYTMHISLQHNTETGRCEVRPDVYQSLKRGMWADVPPSYAKAILADVEDLATATFSDRMDRLGLEADVAQRLCSLERDWTQAALRLRDLANQIEAQHQRLEVDLEG